MIADSTKGDRTRARILDAATAVASVSGVGAVTLGPLADRLGMSKSGLFAHFGSKEALQIETLERAAARFRAEVVAPLTEEPDKARRLELFFRNWIDWVEDTGLGGGCPVLAAAIEFDDVPGPVRDTAVRLYQELFDLIRRLARVARPGADAEAMAAAIHGLAFSHMLRVRLIRVEDARQATMQSFTALLAHPPAGKQS